MKGDFSKAAAITAPNDQAVLFQQGRVTLDRDLTEAELIAQGWRETAARDVIGAGVAAVPAEEPEGYRVTAALVHDGHVDVRLSPGRIWADGIPLTLPPAPGAATRTFGATYLPAPLNPAGTAVGTIADGVRDAVILELALDALNGFQDPARLIEPALGGPDTAERLAPVQRLRLLRLGPGEDCTTIRPRLIDNPSARGRLSVTLEPPTVVVGECPVVEGGGYSGFEHNLYRIEIAETGGGAVRFKWSSLNGGLVGRGRFIGGADPRVEITANRAAILNSGITAYYLEALEFSDHLGHWRAVYGTTATLNADGTIDLATPATFGTMPGAGGTVFFRLWNGIEPIATYAGGATAFRDGIELHFPSGAASYRAEDYWTFDLRAGEIANPETLHANAPPQGPVLRRVALAEINWTGRANTEIDGTIEDCRRRFRPLTNQKLCCTFLVGNGVTSFGDFNSLEEAVAHLPAEGGQVCLLPGIHMANLTLTGLSRVKIHGCRERTLVLPRQAIAAEPVIRIEGGSEIEIADLDLFAPFGIAIDAAGTQAAPLRGLVVRGCRVLALAYGLRVERAERARLADNRIWMLDHIDAHSAISIRATDSAITGNTLAVWPFEFDPPIPGGGDGGNQPPDPADPCIDPEDLYGNLGLVVGYVLGIWLTVVTLAPAQPYRARGGLHLRGGCERIDVTGNRIDGGASHGIVLGGAYPAEAAAAAAANPDPAPAPPPSVAIPAGSVPGTALDEAGSPVIGLSVTLSTAAGTAVQTRVSGPPDGRFVVSVPAASYRIGVTQGYEVVRAAMANGVLTVAVRRVALPDRPDAAFLYQIRIIDNTVERMALSGIGFLMHSLQPGAPLLPASATVEALVEFMAEFFAPRELIGTTNLIRDLEIRGNRIQDNLRAVFTDAMRQIATKVAQGGISLPLVEGLRITDNHIVRNGTSAANPCAGIFVGYGEEVILSGNYISGNGTLGPDYDAQAIEGLRGGVVVRMATAVLAGGLADARERPALDLRDNHIDQPAGRAVTAFAFGPVSCVGNHMNVEREGRFSFIDRFAGAVLIVNLGGIHRHFEALGNTGFGNAAGGGVTGATGLAAKTPVEALLPGGEVLFASNRIRTGGANRAYGSQLILTLDDLGYDANQSAMFKPEQVFANLTAAGMTLRVTDSRFRERSRSTAMSALTMAFGLGGAAAAATINATVHNQGDHCIVALSGTSGPPLIDQPNQVVFDQICPVERGEKTRFLLLALVFLLQIEQQPQLDVQAASAAAPAALGASMAQMGAFQDQLTGLKAVEAIRLEAAGGQFALKSAQMQTEIFRRTEASEALVEQSRLVAVREVEEPTGGALVIDGRVLDVKGMAVAGAEVELVDARGRSLDIGATADAAGYYALKVSEEQKARLARIEGLMLRTVLPGEAAPVRIDAAPLVRAEAGRARADIVTDRLKDFRFDLPGRETLVGRGSVLRDTVIRPQGPVEPDRPVDPVRPVEPDRPVGGGGAAPGAVALEEVRGVGPAIAGRLREAGIADAAGLAAARPARLRELVGARAEALREAAAEALRAAGGRPDGG